MKKGILELVDNSIDEWRLRKRPTLKVELRFDVNKKELSYEDDAGGIKEENLNMVIQPGGTTRRPDEISIGEFGLGLKRGIVALSREAEVVSRFEHKGTFKIKVDEPWKASKSWHIPKFKTTPELQPGRTFINITKMKFDINLEAVAEVRQALGETYGLLLSNNVFTIWVDGEQIQPITFDHDWAYPPEGRHPREYKFFIATGGRRVYVSAVVGLTLTSSQIGEYGFYIYCNDRLILKDYKAPEIGFTTKLLGFPHPTIAYFKCIVKMNGANQDMPWNSTKSGLEFSNPIFNTLKNDLFKLSTTYTRLSRKLAGDGAAQITAYPTGKVETVDLTTRQDFVLQPDQVPTLPPTKRSEAERLLNLNKDKIEKFPWTRALVEMVYAGDLILSKRLENKNRFALLIFDSCLEIAFRDYLMRVKGIPMTKEQLSSRGTLMKMMKKNFPSFDDNTWNALNYFYELRCALYHELAGPEITESDMEIFRDLVTTVMFGLHQLVVGG